jgi:hypothetical protein
VALRRFVKTSTEQSHVGILCNAYDMYCSGSTLHPWCKN